jgi:hypothetical protein
MLESASARGQRYQSPERPREALQPPGLLPEVPAGIAQAHLGASLGKVRQSRAHQIAQEALEIGSGAKGVLGESSIMHDESEGKGE